MNLKVKITFLIIITLVIGIVIGAMLNRAVSQNRIRRILERRNPPIFISFYERIIEPNADQRDSVRKVLDKYAQRLSKIRTNFQDELQSSFESMKAELEPLLTAEQKERLEEGFPRQPRFFPRPFRIRDVNQELSMLKERLGLSEDQASQIKIILEKFWDQAKKMREERESPERGFQIMIELQEKKEQSIKKLLNDDQKKIFEEMEKARRPRHEMMKEPHFPGF
jgi:hypothetical protein